MSLLFLALLSGFASLLFDFENNSWPAKCIFVNTPAPHRIPHVYMSERGQDEGVK